MPALHGTEGMFAVQEHPAPERGRCWNEAGMDDGSLQTV